MAKVGSYINSDVSTGLTIACSDAYNTARRHQLSIWNGVPVPYSGVKLGALYIQVDTIAGAPTGITVRLTRDAAGDNSVIGDTTATLSLGVTTATVGYVTYKLDVPYWHEVSDEPNGILYLFFKTNVVGSTCNVKRIDFVTVE
jgi:hypothetical protein